MYPGRELNPYFRCGKQDFKSCASTSSATRVNKYFQNVGSQLDLNKKFHPALAEWNPVSERRGSNPRPQPWQGCALPAELLSLVNESIL